MKIGTVARTATLRPERTLPLRKAVLAEALPAEVDACRRGAGISLTRTPPGNDILPTSGYGATAQACRSRRPRAAGIRRRDDHGARRPPERSCIVARCHRQREDNPRRAQRPAGCNAVRREA